MEKSTLKETRVSSDRKVKDVEAATKKLQTTESAAVRLADQIGPLMTKLADVNQELLASKNEVFDSVKSVVGDDSGALKKEGRSAEEESRHVADHANDAREQHRKAEGIRPADNRFKDMKEIMDKLSGVQQELEGMKSNLDSASTSAKSQETKTSTAVEAAVRRNQR